MEDITFTQHHLDNHIQIVTNEAINIKVQAGQVIDFITLIHRNIPTFFMPPTLLLAIWKFHYMPGGTIYEGNSLPSVMTKQMIIQATLASIDMFDGTKSKFEAWMESIKNAAQISGQIAYA